MPRPNAGARLARNDRGVYEIRWTENGRSKRSSTGTSHLQSAEKVLGNFLLLDERQTRIEEANGAMLVCAALGDHKSEWSKGDPIPKDYWHEHILQKVVAVDSARFAFDKLHKHFGHIAIAELMPDDVADYVSARKAGTIGRPSVNHTISRELSVLNAAINHAVKAKRLAKSDQPFIQLPGISPPKDRWLSYDEADALIAAARKHVDPRQDAKKYPRVYRFVMLALCTASRRTAVLELKREQVDMERGVIYLNPTGRAQTNKRRAKVPISDELRPVLAQILAEIPNEPDAFLLGSDGATRSAWIRPKARMDFSIAALGWVSSTLVRTLKGDSAS